MTQSRPGGRPVLRVDLSGQDSTDRLTLLPEIVCDTMVRRLMQRKHPISEEIDAQSLYRDHAEWHTRLLPKVQKLVTALGGAERPRPAEKRRPAEALRFQRAKDPAELEISPSGSSR